MYEYNIGEDQELKKNEFRIQKIYVKDLGISIKTAFIIV